MMLWIINRVQALIAQFSVSFRLRFKIKMQLKEVFFLKSQKKIYQVEEDDGKFIYKIVYKINKHSVTIKCRVNTY